MLNFDVGVHVCFLKIGKLDLILSQSRIIAKIIAVLPNGVMTDATLGNLSKIIAHFYF